MVLHIIPQKIAHLVNIILCIICPAIKTHSLLLNKDKITEDKVQYIHFLMYWLFYSIYSNIESFLLSKYILYIPFYYEIKMFFFYWLYSEQFQGAAYIYFKFIEKNYATLDKKICQIVQVKVPDKIKNFFSFAPVEDSPHNKIKNTVSSKDL